MVAAVACAACGRIGFDAPGVERVGAFAQQHFGPGATFDISTSARAAGDAIVLAATCTTGSSQPGVTLTAPGWTFVALSSLAGSTGVVHFGQSFGAIAPDTNPTTVHMSWLHACDTGATLFADEFAGADPTGGTTTFDGHAESEGQGAADATIAIAHAGDVVWGVADMKNHASDVGAGFTRGADDGLGDFAEYKLATNASEEVPYTGGSEFVELAVTIKP